MGRAHEFSLLRAQDLSRRRRPPEGRYCDDAQLDRGAKPVSGSSGGGVCVVATARIQAARIPPQQIPPKRGFRGVAAAGSLRSAENGIYAPDGNMVAYAVERLVRRPALQRYRPACLQPCGSHAALSRTSDGSEPRAGPVDGRCLLSVGESVQDHGLTRLNSRIISTTLLRATTSYPCQC